MALVSREPQPPRSQPREWVEILTANPAQPGRMVSGMSALGVSLFVAALLFALSVVIIQPFFLFYYATRYPNLATTSFTSISLAAGALSLVTLLFLFTLLRRFLRLLFIALGVVMGLAVLVVVGGFFYLFFKEVLLWLLNPDGLPRVLAGIGDFFQFFLQTISPG